jgi:hypothetical protein
LNTAVELEFNPDEWHRLAPSERVQRCQDYAEHARQLSIGAAPELKAGYLDLSRHWLALAEEIDRYAQEGGGPSSAGLQTGGFENGNR